MNSAGRGADVFVDTLQNHGVKYLFGNPGTTEQALLEAISRRSGIDYVLGLHESISLAMADGYTRASGRPGVVNLHSVPGVANATSQLYNAWLGHAPLVVTAGQPDSRVLLNEPVLGGDPAAIVRQWCKSTDLLRHASEIAPALRRAFKLAQQPVCGPCFLALPMDILDAPIDGDATAPIPVAPAPNPAGGAGKAAAAVARAANPAILCGDDVGRAGPDAVAALVQLAEAVAGPVFATGQAQVNFPNSHPLFVRTLHTSSESTAQILAPFDVIVAVGTPLFSQYRLLEPFVRPGCTVIQLDETGWEVGKNIPVDVSIVGDLAVACRMLAADTLTAQDTGAQQRGRERANRLAARKADTMARLAARIETDRGAERISPLCLMDAARAAVPPGAVVVEEAPSSAAALVRVFGFSAPGSLYSARGGAMGWGVPGALGVQMALPGRAVVAFIGDGAAQYSIQGLWTAAHYDLPVKYIICNDRSYHILKVNMTTHLGSWQPDTFVGMDLTAPEIDFVALAEAYGVGATRVDHPPQLAEALNDAIRQPGPRLVDVRIHHERGAE